MAKGSPSLIALLGLLAVAGYQNRDKLGELLNDRRSTDPDREADGAAQGDTVLDSFRNLARGGGAGGLMGGLSELFDRFVDPHQQAKAQSWVQRGPNAPLSPTELEHALDEDMIAELVAKTGLDRRELLVRLSASLPDAIDQATPDGHFPPIIAREPRSA